MRRLDLQMLARAKIEDAQLLLAHGRFGNAYYLAGYAVELGLKAGIARQVLAETIPDKLFLTSVFGHSPAKLVVVAKLQEQLAARRKRDPQFAAHWGIVLDWGPHGRYQDSTETKANEIIRAVADPEKGVLSWIQAFW